MVHALEPEGSHGLVGRINVANVVGGSFRSATIGYDSYDPYAGRGLFAEGLRLVVDLLFADPPLGMGLHRIEANIQPANHRSAGLAALARLRPRGLLRDFLHLPGLDGRRDWRDHERFTMLSTDWPAVPYRAHGHRRIACVVTGPGAPGYGGTGPAAAVAAELGIPLYSAGVVDGTATLFELLRSSPVGGVVECRLTAPELRMGLARAGFEPTSVPVLDGCARPLQAGGRAPGASGSARPSPDPAGRHTHARRRGRVGSTPSGLAEWSAVPVRRGPSRPADRTPTPERRHPARILRGLAALTDRDEETTTVAVKIRLKRMGKIRAPFYRVVVMDSRTKRDGRAIEEIGKYHPTEEPSVIEIDIDRAQYWLGQGAQPTEAVAALLKITGDWQKYKGEPGTEGTLQVKAAKTPKKDLYEAAIAAAGARPSRHRRRHHAAKKAAKKADEARSRGPLTRPSCRGRREAAEAPGRGPGRPRPPAEAAADDAKARPRRPPRPEADAADKA